MLHAPLEPLAAVVHLAEVLCVLRVRRASAHEVPETLPEMVVNALQLRDAEIQQIAYRVYDSESGLEALAA